MDTHFTGVIDVWRHMLALEPLLAAVYLTLCKDISSLIDVSAKYDYMMAIGYNVVSEEFSLCGNFSARKLIWTLRGKKHRLDGPAVDHECGCGAHYLNDKIITYTTGGCVY